MANYCIYCGAPLPEGAGECPQCGREVTDLGMGPAVPARAAEPAANEAPAPAPQKAAAQQLAPPAARQAPPAAEDAPAQPQLVLNDEQTPVLEAKPEAEARPAEPPAAPLDPLNDTVLLGGRAPAPEGPEAPRPAPVPHYQPMGGPRPPRQEGAAGGPAYARGASPLDGRPPQELTLGTAVGMLLVSLIPIVSWVLLLIWSFDQTSSPSRRNLARALLIFKAVQLVLLALGLGLLRGLFYLAEEFLYNFRYFY